MRGHDLWSRRQCLIVTELFSVLALTAPRHAPCRGSAVEKTPIILGAARTMGCAARDTAVKRCAFPSKTFFAEKVEVLSHRDFISQEYPICDVPMRKCKNMAGLRAEVLYLSPRTPVAKPSYFSHGTPRLSHFLPPGTGDVGGGD